LARVVVTRRAESDLKELPQDLREAVDEKVLAIGADPRAAGKELRGRLKGRWSAAVRDRRILYRIRDDGATVVIDTVGHRATVYRTR
jgi:mRNA-degrading endonuclease RelE of RelBE toxin-antitoxin system